MERESYWVGVNSHICAQASATRSRWHASRLSQQSLRGATAPTQGASRAPSVTATRSPTQSVRRCASGAAEYGGAHKFGSTPRAFAPLLDAEDALATDFVRDVGMIPIVQPLRLTTQIGKSQKLRLLYPSKKPSQSIRTPSDPSSNT